MALPNVDDTFIFWQFEASKNEDDAGHGGGHHPKKRSTSGLKKSAAGLCVGMGCFADPEELPGLAHFLEHMVSPLPAT
jgi:nardilysin